MKFYSSRNRSVDYYLNWESENEDRLERLARDNRIGNAAQEKIDKEKKQLATRNKILEHKAQIKTNNEILANLQSKILGVLKHCDIVTVAWLCQPEDLQMLTYNIEESCLELIKLQQEDFLNIEEITKRKAQIDAMIDNTNLTIYELNREPKILAQTMEKICLTCSDMITLSEDNKQMQKFIDENEERDVKEREC